MPTKWDNGQHDKAKQMEATTIQLRKGKCKFVNKTRLERRSFIQWTFNLLDEILYTFVLRVETNTQLILLGIHFSRITQNYRKFSDFAMLYFQ